jgi:hypothetical protein
MQYLYCFANISLTLRLIDYLSKRQSLKLDSLTVIYLVDRWVARIKLKQPLNAQLAGDFLAFLNENGAPYKPLHIISEALQAIDRGQPLTDVMNRYQVVIVSDGAPNPYELKNFRQRFVEGLGYCPQNLV